MIIQQNGKNEQLSKISRYVKHLKQPVDDILNISGIKYDFTKPADIATAARTFTATGYAQCRASDWVETKRL